MGLSVLRIILPCEGSCENSALRGLMLRYGENVGSLVTALHVRIIFGIVSHERAPWLRICEKRPRLAAAATHGFPAFATPSARLLVVLWSLLPSRQRPQTKCVCVCVGVCVCVCVRGVCVCVLCPRYSY